jgi:glycosyltransferase involved in cell wall biosynthesis
MVSQLAEGLAAEGHKVTLYAKAGSKFKGGTLVCPPDAKGYEGEKLLARACMQDHYADPFDAIFDHSHTHEIARLYPDMPTVNVFHDMWQTPVQNAVVPSEGIRAMMPSQMWNAQVIHNALPHDDFPLGDGKGGYLAYLGAIVEYKNPMLCIEAAARFGLPLKIAGGPKDAFVWGSGGNTEYVGELDHAQKVKFLQNAAAFLQLGPTESFGLTALEASLCGTPVVAVPSGGNMDVVRQGENGAFVPVTGSRVKNVCDAISLALDCDREGVRQSVVERFDPHEQLRKYEDVLFYAMQGASW